MADRHRSSKLLRGNFCCMYLAESKYASLTTVLNSSSVFLSLMFFRMFLASFPMKKAWTGR
jgi:hypothetical protein